MNAIIKRMGKSLIIIIHPFLLFFFFFFFFISFHPNHSLVSSSSSSSYNNNNNNSYHSCPPQQTLALLQFKHTLLSINDSFPFDECQEWPGFGYHPKMMNWSNGTDCCWWDGVTCNRFTGHVIALDLTCGMLQGTIHPNSTLFHLPHLQRLNLAYNDFFLSQIPHQIGRFANTLTHLNISHCRFSGPIPLEISLLPKLVSLDLSWNFFDFPIEPQFFNNLFHNSTLLRELSLASVNISSDLPPFLNFSFSSSLRFLDLSYTQLYGKLPEDIFSLPYLEKLSLSRNSALTGSFPKVNRTTNIPLKWLDLSYTGLPGEIPDSIGHLTSLDVLDLSYCQLVGPLPKSLGNLIHLSTLSLWGNMLNGTLPSWLFTLPSLENIDLRYNMFSGSIPSDLFTQQSLKIISLGSNQLVGQIDVLDQGQIPQSFQQLINLTILDLSFNNFTGVWDLDTLLSSLSNLEELDLSYSGLSIVTNNANHHVDYPYFSSLSLASCKLTVFPESLRAMTNLTSLDLSNNQIHGLPDWAAEIGGNQLGLLDLSHNFIAGLPQFQWVGLQHLNLKSNKIQGTFPPSICNLSQLSVLDMSNNFFYGVIPECFGNIISFLEMVDLGNNHFHGTIPKVYNDCKYLQGLILNGNQLEGEVPTSLSKCRSLQVLDLGNNQLNDTFPGWLDDLPELQVLVLKSNNFHGSVRISSVIEHPFPELRIFDLSQNGFVGDLPEKYFINFKAMRNIVKKGTKPEYMQTSHGGYYSITVVVKNVLIPFTKILVAYTIIDLSNNRFEREIPDVIGILDSLKVLNLSHNSLTGRIPHTLGNLLEIESLDLSHNQLIGEIPQQLAALNTLEVLNLSHNHLVGRIPQGPQLNTFDGNSFIGNQELCGLPLPIKCELPQSRELEADDEDDKSAFSWKVVMLGYGCGTLVGIEMGYLMFRTRRPKWFIETVDELEHRIQKR